jgi:glycosyltransferase involved in cell wall biosynthesis
MATLGSDRAAFQNAAGSSVRRAACTTALGLMRSKPLRVAIVAPSLRILGGQAVQADRLLRAWQGDPDVEAWLVPVNPAARGIWRRAERIKYLRTLVTQLMYWPLLLRELRRADIVHIFSASYYSFLLAPLPALLVGRLFRKPVVVNYRSGEAPDHLARSAVSRLALSRTDANVVPSVFLARVFGSHGLQARVVHNIVSAEEFQYRERNPLRPRLLSTRNFEPLYNVACTLRAFRLVQDRHPDATLTVVGGGAEEESLRRLAASLGLRGVQFVGRVAPTQMARYYAAADIYVQTPNIDNMPSSVLEAFASGTPAVSTDAGGVPAILTHEVHGLLAPVNDHAAVAAHVVRLLEEPGLAARLTAAALRSCETYSWANVRTNWLAVYRDVMHPERKALAGARATS